MGFRTVLLGTMGIIVMLSTSAIGQSPGNMQSFFSNLQSKSPASNKPLLSILGFLEKLEEETLKIQPSHTPQNSPPSGQPGGISPHPNAPQYNPSNPPPAGFNPYNSQLSSPQGGALSPLSHQLSPQQPFPSVPLPGSLNPSIHPPNLYSPPHYPSNTPSLDFNPYHSPQIFPQPPSHITKTTNFNSYNSQLNTQQQYSSGNQHTSLNAPNPPTSTQQQFSPNSNPHYQPSSNQQLGTSSTDSKPSYSNQTPSSSSNQPGGSSTSTTTNQNASSSSPGSGSTEPTSVHHVSSSHGHASSASKQHPHHPPIPDDGDPLQGHRIVCIFNNQHFYRDGFTPSEIEPHLCTHINYEFAVLDPKTYEVTTGEPDLDIEMDFFQKVIDLKKANDKLKIILSVGGWVDSTKKYSEMAADAEKRKSFVESCVSYVKKHEFDGMDLAWEYPNCWQGAIGINPADKDNFVLLLKDLQTGLKKENLIFSVSVGGIKREMEAAYNIPEISNIVDYLNVMTYDMHGPWEPVTGHHMQFDTMPGDSDPYCNVKAAMDLWYQKGADKSKLNLGIAFYGRTFTLADPNNHGIGAPGKGIGDPGPDSNDGGLLLYSEICQFLNVGNWTEEEDKQAGFYAYSGNQWAGYDNPMMVVRKTKYVISAGYGGVLIKYLSGDDFKGLCFNMDFPLLKMIKLEMTQSIRKASRHRRHHG